MIEKQEQDTPEVVERSAPLTRSSKRPPFVSFRGNCIHSLDDKGRISLPSEFRRVLGEREQSGVVLTNYISEGARCIEGFSLDVWKTSRRGCARRVGLVVSCSGSKTSILVELQSAPLMAMGEF